MISIWNFLGYFLTSKWMSLQNFVKPWSLKLDFQKASFLRFWSVNYIFFWWFRASISSLAFCENFMVTDLVVFEISGKVDQPLPPRLSCLKEYMLLTVKAIGGGQGSFLHVTFRWKFQSQGCQRFLRNEDILPYEENMTIWIFGLPYFPIVKFHAKWPLKSAI